MESLLYSVSLFLEARWQKRVVYKNMLEYSHFPGFQKCMITS